MPNFFQMLRNEAISKPKFIRNYFTDELPCLGTSWKVTDNCNVSPSSWVGSDLECLKSNMAKALGDTKKRLPLTVFVLT